MHVKAKKHLGQHFLRNDQICSDIARSLTGHGNYDQIIEIGPGTGALTKHLLDLPYDLRVVEVDQESIDYLIVHVAALRSKIIGQDFLQLDLQTLSGSKPMAVIGNFPYNISSQILFHVLEYRDCIPEVVGMFQKEVAERVAEGPGSRDYGILSVLLQAWYDIEYLFTVGEQEFIPPPKVKSGVIRLKRNSRTELGCNESQFKQVVKLAFNQRRKTIRNSTRSLCTEYTPIEDPLFSKRPEQLGVEEFILLTRILFPKG